MPDVNWFDGYEAANVPAWGPRLSSEAGEIYLTAGPQIIELGMVTRVTARTWNMDYVGRTAILTVTNEDVGAPWYTAVMEPDAEDGLFCIFEVVGINVGSSILSVEVF